MYSKIYQYTRYSAYSRTHDQNSPFRGRACEFYRAKAYPHLPKQVRPGLRKPCVLRLDFEGMRGVFGPKTTAMHLNEYPRPPAINMPPLLYELLQLCGVLCCPCLVGRDGWRGSRNRSVWRRIRKRAAIVTSAIDIAFFVLSVLVNGGFQVRFLVFGCIVASECTLLVYTAHTNKLRRFNPGFM